MAVEKKVSAKGNFFANFFPKKVSSKALSCKLLPKVSGKAQFCKLLPKVSGIMLNWNGKKLTERALKLIKENFNYPNFELLVIDNASSDGSVEMLERMKKQGFLQKLIKNKENLGSPKAWNQGIKATDGEYFLIIDNDIEWLSKNALWEAVKVLEANPKAAAVCFSTYWQQPEEKAMNKPDKEVPEIYGAAFVVDRKKFEEIGEFDEKNFSPAYGEETDWSYRARAKGFKLLQTEKARVGHIGSVTSIKRFAKGKYTELMNTHGLQAMLFNLKFVEILKHVPGLAFILLLSIPRGTFFSVMKAYWNNLKNWKKIALERKKRGVKWF